MPNVETTSVRPYAYPLFFLNQILATKPIPNFHEIRKMGAFLNKYFSTEYKLRENQPDDIHAVLGRDKFLPVFFILTHRFG
jgi:hypothetical protein